MEEVIVSSSSEEWMEEEQELEMEMKKESSRSVIKWENFLPRMFIRVLLVEADDSTRQIISALLRKCGYKAVTAVSDGSKAWEMLKGRAHNIDLVLTEVELPSISGFSLLDMITEHESCKNLPVIMMSTHDSIGVVFKCMLKGAADFFIKPVRKNELSNLWQHVWRRHNQSSSGGNGLQDQQKIGVISETNTASNHTNDYVARAQNNKECSDKESDAQSSCTKPDMEAESACIRKSKSPSHMCDTEIQKHREFVEEEYASARKTTPCKDVIEETHREDNNNPCETKHHDNEQVGPPREAIDLIGSFDDRRQLYAAVREVVCNGSKFYSDSIETTNKLELSLRRFHPSDCGYQQIDERRTLNHSNLSAFSPYNNRTTSLDFHTEPKESVDNTPKHILKQLLVSTTDAPQLNGSMLNINQESLTPQVRPSQAATRFPCPQFGVVRTPVPVNGTSFDGLCSGYGTLFPPMLYTQSCQPSLWSPTSVNHQKSAFFESSSCRTRPESNSFEPVDDLHDQNDESCSDQIMDEQPNVESVENQVHLTPDTDQSGSSSLCNGAASHLNGSGYGSIYNGSNGNVIRAAVARAISECGNDEGLLGHDGTKGMDPLRSTQREMALNKFRLKRKDRCFEKKVRYQSRKKLAEQRPRVKGQFVRQVTGLTANLPLTETNC
ncbi:Signal transduction response regulator [Macleaya cordata]|uniref:Signal transduction response regulator n=1 Tax=Macleaya cordata TaxID=56857 RepID=A0A200Q2J7_MACCD|nr:Signal transduction response regulator [Macleaya cordata]